MIIRIQANGGSFRGAGLYYLHDKSDDPTLEKYLKPSSDDRVWFTDTRNCLSMDPSRAIEEMWLTAEDQAYLKMQAGVKRGGRVCENPVKTLSMSWHKDDQPTPEHMVEAADALMKHMGWDAHQAVYVGHNDTEHRHVHIMLNRVNPETGRTLDDYREQKRSQSWALEYERSQDLVRCEQREINAQTEKNRDRANDKQHETVPSQPENARTEVRLQTVEIEPDFAAATEPTASYRRAANDHLPYNVVMMTRQTEREFNADEKTRAVHAATDRADLKAEQRAEREAFFDAAPKLFKAVRHAVYDEVRREYRTEWRDLYRQTSAARRSAEKASELAISRAHYFAKDGQWDKAREAFKDRNSVVDAVEEKLAASKADLTRRQKLDLRERQRDACDALRQVRDAQYEDLLRRQRYERAALQAGESLDAAAGIGRDRPSYAFPKSPEQASNENRSNEVAEHQRADREAGSTVGTPVVSEAHAQHAVPDARQVAAQVEQSAAIVRTIDLVVENKQTAIEVPRPDSQEQTPIAPVRGVSDHLAGGIGGAASYLADQLGELFAPTPPEVREAQAKAATQQASERETQKPERDDKAAAYARLIDSAVRHAEAERAQKDDVYWKDRHRDKGWERDQ